MLRHIGDDANSWQRPILQHRLVLALLGVLIALSYALPLTGEEAQAKEGNQSSTDGSAEEVIAGSAQPAQEVAGEVNKLASNEEAGGKDAGSIAARDPAPRADKPTPADDGTVREAARSTINKVADKAPSAVDPATKTNPPIVERTGTLGEAAGTAREATRTAVASLDEATSVARPALEGEIKLPRAEPILDEATKRLSKIEPNLEETAKPEISPVLNRVASDTAPVLERATAPARPVLEETTSTVEPLLDTASSKIEPVLERATAPVNSVLEKTTSTVEPVLGEANTPAAPILEEANPPVEPTLDGAIPAIEPSGQAVGPVVRSLGEEAIPTAGPVLEEEAFPGVELTIGAAVPVFDHVSDTVAPVLRFGFGEGLVRQSAGKPVLEGNAGAIPASLPALPSHAPAIETWGALESARYYGPGRAEPPASAVEPSVDRSGFFDGSFAIGGSHAALLGAVTAEDAGEGLPRPFPFGFPPAAPPVGTSFGSSSAGVALDLLAILALLPVLSRVGGLSWSNLAAFRLGSSLQLAVERPG